MSKYGEPWKAHCVIVGLGDGTYHGVLLTSANEPDGKTKLAGHMEYLKRAVECVNACAGLDISNVPAGAVRELVEMLRKEVDCALCTGDCTECDYGKALAPFKGE